MWILPPPHKAEKAFSDNFSERFLEGISGLI
jgi:hypothetical protein